MSRTMQLRKKIQLLSVFLALLMALSLGLMGAEIAQAADDTYMVQRGDSLTQIASRFGISVEALAKANGIVNVNYIYAGQTLTIPGKNTAPSKPAPTPATTGQQGYIVQRGDNLSAIAERYGVSVVELASANGISVMDYIYVGQNLRIPGKSAAPAPAVIVAPTPTPIPQGGGAVVAPVPVVAASGTGKWVDVNLSKQRLVAYEGDVAVFSTAVSTGVSRHPTVTGTFNVYAKYSSQAMTGGSGSEYYYLPGVPYVMYFYSGYAIHGTYWHNNFGHPMSHGCVNLPTAAAKFMYGWAPIGTTVKVHY